MSYSCDLLGGHIYGEPSPPCEGRTVDSGSPAVQAYLTSVVAHVTFYSDPVKGRYILNRWGGEKPLIPYELILLKKTRG